MSVCVLSTLTVYSNIKQQFIFSNNRALYFEQMKLASKYLSLKLTDNDVNVHIYNNNLYIDSEKFMNYENEMLTIYQDNIVIYNEKMKNVEFIYCNDHLLLLRLQDQGLYLERYYYLGGVLSENKNT